jgi:hypothetical protein
MIESMAAHPWTPKAEMNSIGPAAFFARRGRRIGAVFVFGVRPRFARARAAAALVGVLVDDDGAAMFAPSRTDTHRTTAGLEG